MVLLIVVGAVQLYGFFRFQFTLRLTRNLYNLMNTIKVIVFYFNQFIFLIPCDSENVLTQKLAEMRKLKRQILETIRLAQTEASILTDMTNKLCVMIFRSPRTWK